MNCRDVQVDSSSCVMSCIFSWMSVILSKTSLNIPLSKKTLPLISFSLSSHFQSEKIVSNKRIRCVTYNTGEVFRKKKVFQINESHMVKRNEGTRVVEHVWQAHACITHHASHVIQMRGKTVYLIPWVRNRNDHYRRLR